MGVVVLTRDDKRKEEIGERKRGNRAKEKKHKDSLKNVDRRKKSKREWKVQKRRIHSDDF